ncbi:early nodulin-like protein 6 [Phragmites australis]|uniref:early nodulin-like protein 6 n=1 Tax=Phragmites australis TaxID=29695 RepID=UPI002D78B918|nr:early nodulin-like protein 6 [Phragmites australis]
MARLHLVVFAASCALLAASVSSLPPAVVFNVGDERGWTVPSGNSTETYNHWAKRNRFQVGDVLNFKYANDSVLLVSHDDYKQCNTESPLSRFTDGDTKFTFDRYGLFYFVSGIPGHCEAGQRMIARVMAPSALSGAPTTAPPAMPPTVSGGGGGASNPVSSPGVLPGSSPTSTSTQSPSPLPQASGASRRVLSVVSSIVVGLVVVGVVFLFVLV